MRLLRLAWETMGYVIVIAAMGILWPWRRQILAWLDPATDALRERHELGPRDLGE